MLQHKYQMLAIKCSYNSDHIIDIHSEAIGHYRLWILEITEQCIETRHSELLYISPADPEYFQVLDKLIRKTINNPAYLDDYKRCWEKSKAPSVFN